MELLDGRCYVAWFWNRYLQLLKQTDELTWPGHRLSLWNAVREELQSWTDRQTMMHAVDVALGAEKRVEGVTKARFARRLGEEIRVMELLSKLLPPEFLTQALVREKEIHIERSRKD